MPCDWWPAPYRQKQFEAGPAVTGVVIRALTRAGIVTAADGAAVAESPERWRELSNQKRHWPGYLFGRIRHVDPQLLIAAFLVWWIYEL